MHRSALRAAVSAVAAAALVAGALVTASPAQAATDVQWLPWVGPTGTQAEAWVRVFDTSGTTMYAGTEGAGVFRSTDNGVTWSAFGAGLSGDAANIRAIEAGPSDVLVGTTSGLFVSQNGGSWQPLGQGAGNNTLNAAVQTIHRSGDRLLVGVVGGVYRSTDGGATWTPSSAGLPAGTTVWSIDSYPVLPSVLLAATSAGAFRSSDDGNTWTPASDGLPTGTNVLRIMADVVPTTWFAITGGAGVYRSRNSGLTWEPVNNGLGANLATRSIAIQSVGAATNIEVGTQDGVFVSYDRGDSWQRIGNAGLGGKTITWAISTVPGAPLSLLVGTQGGGVHYRQMTPPVNTAAPVLNDTTPVVGQTLSTTNGTWVGTADILYSYQWQYCTANDPSWCFSIPGATQSTYVVRPEDLGDRIRAVVRAKNPASPPGYENSSAGNEATAISAIVTGDLGSLGDLGQ